MSAPSIEEPVTKRTGHAADQCTCEAYRHADSTRHARTCVGSHPTGWRARVPEFLCPEYERIRRGERRDAPIFRTLAMECAISARFGNLVEEITR